MHAFFRNSIFILAVAVIASFALCGSVAAQDSAGDESSRAGEPVKIEPYTGSPIFLDESGPQPDATFVSKMVDSTKYADGKVRFEREIAKYSDNRLVAEGFYREFYPNGEKFAEGQYVKGRQDGDWTFWHDNGKIARKVHYTDGQPDGEWEVYREDGSLNAKRSYDEGKRDGVWVAYDEAGKQPLREESYKAGKADGAWKIWFPNGQLQTEMHFQEGSRHGQTLLFDDKGTKRADVKYADNLLEGTATVWGADGKKVVQQYEKGKLVSEKKD